VIPRKPSSVPRLDIPAAYSTIRQCGRALIDASGHLFPPLAEPSGFWLAATLQERARGSVGEVEQDAAAVLKELLSKTAAECGALTGRTRHLRPDQRRAVRCGDDRGKAYLRCGSGFGGERCQGADRTAAAGVEGGEDSAFGERGCPGRCVVEGRELGRGDGVVGAALDRQHALRRGGHEQGRVEGDGARVE
jgi:hypothetical protein